MECRVDKRDSYFDSVKGLLIILVVLGHLIEENIYNLPLAKGVFNFIYSFHMPLFVFISGYFTSKNGLTKKNFAGLLNVLFVFVFFDIAHRITEIYSGSFVYGDLITPSWTMWYLFCLIFWRLVVYLMHSFIDIWFIPFSFLIGLLAGFINVNSEFSLQRFLAFFPFFISGYVLSQKEFVSFVKKERFFRYALGLFGCIFFVYMLFIRFEIRNVVFLNLCYGDCYYGFLQRLFFYFISSILSFLLLNIISRFNEFLAGVGRNSMFIYIYHTFFVVISLKIVKAISLDNSISAFFLSMLFVVCGLFLIKKVMFFEILLRPVPCVARFLR